MNKIKKTINPHLPSAHIRISANSAGVPTKDPTAPAVIPIPAFIAKAGALSWLQRKEHFIPFTKYSK